jgi:ABC-type glycerol-3-phosphate transport system substrate-binding protein
MASEHRLNRRRFLSATGGGVAAAAFLATHGIANAAPGASSSFRAPAAQVSDQEIRLLIREDIKSAYAADAAVELWQSQFPAKVSLDVPPGGADVSQKIQAAQAAGDLVWDGFAVMEVPWNTSEWVSRGLIVPLDDYVAASQIPDAAAVIAGIIPSIAESLKFDGKQYSVPGNVGSVSLAWMTEPLQRAGVTEGPISWDEVHEAATKLHDAAPEFTPFDSATTPLCDLWSMIWGASDNPFTQDGLVDITGEASIAALEWMKTMVSEELMPPVRTSNGGVNQNFQDWQKGGTAIITSYDVAATIAQQTFGQDAAVNGVNMRQDKAQVRAGTPFWVNASVVLNKAKNPQGMTDFLLWWFGPSNDATGKQIAEVAAKPCYQYTYDKFVVGNPTYQWEADAIEIVRNSVPFPANNTTSIQQQYAQPWVEKVIGGDVDAAEGMQNALKDINDQLAKLKA